MPDRTPFEKITLEATDGHMVTADLYQQDDHNAPVMLLCHQAGYSRGEYRETALRLFKMGYTCLAIDQRSGGEVNGVINETAELARINDLQQTYVDALPDIVGAGRYARKTLKASRVMMVGSSYSSSLAIVIAAKYPVLFDAVASFSPGLYFTIDAMSVSEWAAKIQSPIFMTSARQELLKWRSIYEAITIDAKVGFKPTVDGVHGSRSLWPSTEGNDEYWAALTDFLSTYFPVTP